MGFWTLLTLKTQWVQPGGSHMSRAGQPVGFPLLHPLPVLWVFLPGAGGANILPITANARQINTGAFQALMSRAHLSPENNLTDIDT